MKLTRSDAESAAQHLGITSSIDAVTMEEVRRAFRTAVFSVHPDTTAEAAFNVADVITTLRAARDMLIEWVSGRPDPSCPMCKGTGYTRPGVGSARFHSRPCPKCT